MQDKLAVGALAKQGYDRGFAGGAGQRLWAYAYRKGGLAHPSGIMAVAAVLAPV